MHYFTISRALTVHLRGMTIRFSGVMALPLGTSLSSRVSTPLGGARSTRSSRAPVSSGLSGSSTPFLSGGDATGLEASGSSTPGVGGDGLRLGLNQLLLLNLLLGLSLRVAVCERLLV